MIDMEQSDQTVMKILKGLNLSFTVKPVGDRSLTLVTCPDNVHSAWEITDLLLSNILIFTEHPWVQ